MTTTDLEVFVEYGFVDLTGDTELADLHLSRQGQRNGICGAKVDGHLSMITGTHTGSIAFRVEVHDTAPAVEDLWEEVVEVSVELPAGSMQLATFDDWHDVPAMVPGWHRARYCAVAMDEGRDADPPEGLAVDRYLLVLWPAPFAPEVVVRQSSGTARYWASVADGTEKEYVDQAREQEWSTDGIDPQMWGGELPTQELLKAGNYAPAMAMIDRPLAVAVAGLSEDGHRAVTAWVCARMAPQARAVAGIDWPALAQTVASGLPAAPPFDDRTRVDGLMFGLDRDGFPDLPEPPIEKGVLAAWAILDPLTFPEEWPVEDAMRALVNGYDADASPEAFMDSARDLVVTLS